MRRVTIWRIVAGFTVVAALAGAALLAWGMYLPVYSNEAAYSTTNSDITNQLYNDEISSSEAVKRFYANQAENMTSKYTLEDAGLACLVAALYGGLALLSIRSMRRTGKTVPKGWLYVVSCGSLLAFGFLLVLSVFLSYMRGLLPPWADSLGIPIFGTGILLSVVLPPLAGTTYWLARKYRRQLPNTQLSDFRALSSGQRAYFVIAAIMTMAAATVLLWSPGDALVVVPIVFGGILFHFLLFTGIQRQSG